MKYTLLILLILFFGCAKEPAGPGTLEKVVNVSPEQFSNLHTSGIELLYRGEIVSVVCEVTGFVKTAQGGSLNIVNGSDACYPVNDVVCYLPVSQLQPGSHEMIMKTQNGDKNTMLWLTSESRSGDVTLKLTIKYSIQ